jgi:hypothetical protein
MVDARGQGRSGGSRSARPSAGARQREAVTALERAIDAVLAGDAAALGRALERLAEVDGAGLWTEARQVLARLAEPLSEGASPSPATWAALRTALGPGPLAARVPDASPPAAG